MYYTNITFIHILYNFHQYKSLILHGNSFSLIMTMKRMGYMLAEQFFCQKFSKSGHRGNIRIDEYAIYEIYIRLCVYIYKYIIDYS